MIEIVCVYIEVTKSNTLMCATASPKGIILRLSYLKMSASYMYFLLVDVSLFDHKIDFVLFK